MLTNRRPAAVDAAALRMLVTVLQRRA